MKGQKVETEYGVFEIIRKDAVAITVVKTKRPISHHYVAYNRNEITHIEHRKIPKFFVRVQSNCGGWGVPLGTFDLNGNIIELR